MARDDIDQALASYSRYLSQYPQGSMADQALSRIGEIYQKQGMFDEAQAFYQRLITQFPGSPAANEARLAIIDLLIQNGKPAEAIARAEELLTPDADDATRRKLWQKLALHYGDIGQTANAVAYTYLLYKSAPEAEKEQWADKLKTGISRLNGEEITRLWDRMDDDFARSHLMYRYATEQVVADNYDEAIEVLIAFAEAYPDHPFFQDAVQIIDTLEKRLSFKPQTVGCLLPLSGSYRLYGQRALNGIELALSLLQSREQNSRIRLVIKDSASQSGSAVAGVRALDEARVGVIIGPIVTAASAAGEAQKRNIPMVTITQKSDITEMGDYIFRHFITPQSQVKTLVSYFSKEIGLRDFAIMYPEETYGQTFMTLFWDEVIRQGGSVVGVESYGTQQTDFADTIKKLVGTYYAPPADLEQESAVKIEDNPYFQKTSSASNALEDILSDPVSRLTGLFFQDPDQNRVRGPSLGRQQQQEIAIPNIDFDVLFIPDAPKATGLILPQLAYYDVRDIYLAGTNLWHSDQLISMTRDYAQNAIMPEGFFKQSPEKPVQQFVQAFKDLYGEEPGLIEAFAFDTARLLFKLLSQSELHHRHVLRDALLQLYEPDGVTGPTAFDENGEAIKRLSLLKIKGGQFVEIPRP